VHDSLIALHEWLAYDMISMIDVHFDVMA